MLYQEQGDYRPRRAINQLIYLLANGIKTNTIQTNSLIFYLHCLLKLPIYHLRTLRNAAARFPQAYVKIGHCNKYIKISHFTKNLNCFNHDYLSNNKMTGKGQKFL